MKFKVKERNNWFGKSVYWFFRTFLRTPEIINIGEEQMPEKCIMIGNHVGMSGPFNYNAFIRTRFMTWGAHQMLENYTSRRRYLRDVFYRQKKGMGKFKSALLSTIVAVFSPIVYTIAGVVPIYYDERIRHTLKYSIDCLEKDVSVLIFPEDAERGYHDTLERFLPGFISLAKLYYRRHGVDLPIFPMYFIRKPNKKIVIGKAFYYQELAKDKTDEEILRFFVDYVNSLAYISSNGQ